MALPELQDRGLSLCQDADSAHTSKETTKWAKDNDLNLITLPGVSPDLSICETIARGLKQEFYKRRYTTEKAAMARFKQVFKEIDEKKVQY